jgi:hypothetical protein
MKLEDIHAAWAEHAKIDEERQDQESRDIPILHAKFLRMLSDERMVQRAIQKEADLLKRDKADWYSGSMAKEDLEARKWKPNPKVILRQDVDKYVQGDSDVVELNLRLGLQQEKVDVLNEVLRCINSRSFHIGRSIDWIKFKHGLS